MIIKDFQFVNSLDTGSTTLENDICDYFKIDKSQKPEKVRSEIDEKLFILHKDYDGKKLKIADKWFLAEKDFFECSYEQFVRMDVLLAENNNIKNLDKLLAIYCRPRIFNWKKLRYEIEPFNLQTQEKIQEILKNNMKMEDAYAVVLFFYQNITRSLRNINIFYLNQKKLKDLH